MTKTGTAITAATATTCLAAALMSIGMVSRANHALAVSQTDDTFAIKSEFGDTSAIKRETKALATKSITLYGLEMISGDGELIAAINPFVTKPDNQFLEKSDSDDLAPKPQVRNAFDTNLARGPLATKFSNFDLFAIKLANVMLPTGPATSNAVGKMLDGYQLLAFGFNDAFVVKLDDDMLLAKLPPALVTKPSARDVPVAASDALAEPNRQLPAVPHGDALLPGPATKKVSEVRPASDASSTKLAVKYHVAIRPNSPKPEIRNPMAISRPIMENKWQYCLAPSYAEHKIYLSSPIPLNGYFNGADSEFNQVLTRAGLAHDAVQCPRAPNKPTLLFRQKYSISFNKEIGNVIINVNWD